MPDNSKKSSGAVTQLTEIVATAPKTTRMDYAKRQMSDFRRWARRKFSKDNLLDSFKTFAWVAPLTVLIWVYAEREQILPVTGFQVPIELRSADPDSIVTLPKQDKNLQIDLSGPRAAIDKIREQLSGDSPAVILTIDRKLSPGVVHSLDPVLLLNSNEIFRSKGVTVTSCSPVTLNVYVDVNEERVLDVETPPEVKNLASTPIFEPAKVTIRGPKSVFDHAAPHVYADLKEVESLSPGEPHELPSVRLRTTDPTLIPSVSTVKATVNVREADVDRVIGSIPVWVSAPPQAQYDFQLSPTTLANVKIVGPPDRIEMLDQPDVPKPKARVDVSPGTFKVGEPQMIKVHYDLIEGLHPATSDEGREVQVTMIKRSDG